MTPAQTGIERVLETARAMYATNQSRLDISV
jgi:hypothetical protein